MPFAGHDLEEADDPFFSRQNHDARYSSATEDYLTSPPSSHNASHHQIRGVSAELEKAETVDEVPSRRSTASQKQSRAQSALSTIRSRRPIPTFTHPLSHEKTAPNALVEFDGPKDPYNPLNWTFRKKVVTTSLYGFTTMGATFASSVYSPAIEQVAEHFDINTEVSTLGLALILFGFALGPLIWAPLSEVFGRKPAVLAPYFVAAVFMFGSATAKDVQTLMITRFFAGFFAAGSITNTGGVMGDIWNAEQRGTAIVCYAMAVVGGPTLGPIIGGAIVESHLGWRWTFYVTGILMMFLLALDVLLLDESFQPVLLVYKARRLRHETGNWALHAKHEEWDVSLRELSRKYLVRPFQLLTTPICFLMALYASFVYGILYAQFAAFPIVFEQSRGWNHVLGGLPFLALLVGIAIGAVANIVNQRYYVRCFVANHRRPVPEARLPPMMGGSLFFAGGLFIFAWTARPDIHWIAPNVGAVCVGIGFFTIFLAALNYLIDTFQAYAASAVAANTCLRSVLGGAFPLFISPLLKKVGVDWGVSIFGFVAVALLPIPYLFFIFGKRIRARGEFSKASVT